MNRERLQFLRLPAKRADGEIMERALKIRRDHSCVPELLWDVQQLIFSLCDYRDWIRWRTVSKRVYKWCKKALRGRLCCLKQQTLARNTTITVEYHWFYLFSGEYIPEMKDTAPGRPEKSQHTISVKRCSSGNYNEVCAEIYRNGFMRCKIQHIKRGTYWQFYEDRFFLYCSPEKSHVTIVDLREKKPIKIASVNRRNHWLSQLRIVDGMLIAVKEDSCAYQLFDLEQQVNMHNRLVPISLFGEPCKICAKPDSGVFLGTSVDEQSVYSVRINEHRCRCCMKVCFYKDGKFCYSHYRLPRDGLNQDTDHSFHIL